MKRLRLYLTFLFILLLAAGAVYLNIPQGSKISLKPLKIDYSKSYKLNLGLDLQGGTHLVYEVI